MTANELRIGNLLEFDNNITQKKIIVVGRRFFSSAAIIKSNHKMEKKIYVCGFCFDYSREKVALIKKNRPDWQKGKLNGIGGKVEVGETIHQAMQREFKEETGVDVWAWNLFCTYEGEDYIVYFMKAFSKEVENVTTTTDEEVNLYVINYLNCDIPRWARNETIDNLKWLIPLAKDVLVNHSQVSEYIKS